MGLVSNGVENVNAFDVPVGIRSDGSQQAAIRRVLVEWCSSHSDKLHQVYANGRLAGVTADCDQRRMLCQIPSSLSSSVRIEVFAVSASEADEDLSDEVASAAADDGRVRIRMLRSQGLAIDSQVEIYGDGGAGTVDYSEPLSDGTVWIWPSVCDKAGFGQSDFGVVDFGYESSAAVGFGEGSFGMGMQGLDADEFEWVSGQLSLGTYKFGVKVVDGNGRRSSAVETGSVFVGPAAEGAEGVSVDSFSRSTNVLELSISQ